MTWLSERSRNGGIDEVPLPSGNGRLWLCGKHFVGPDPEAVLERTGATTIVCLNQGPEFAERYPAYFTWLRDNAGGRALWHAMPDLHAAVGDIETVVDLVRARLDNDEGVVVHCGAGIGRAGTIAAGVLISMGVDLDDALARVVASRPTAGPQSYEQEVALRDYASSTRNTAAPRGDSS